MKVLYVYRSKELKMHSIENCFSIVRDSLSNELQIDECYVPFPKANLTSIIKNALYVRKTYKKNKYDVVHITGDIHYACLFLPRKKTILTIHDVRGLYAYKGFKKFIYTLLWIKMPIFKSSKITCISNFTSAEVLSVYKKAKRKIVIIPDPINDILRPSIKNFNSVTPSVLMIGTIPNKNIERAAIALRDIKCKLTIIGVLSKSQIEVLTENNINYTNLINLDDYGIYEEYLKSDIVLFPSTYEGFGMIVIEAQMVGRVVVTSNIEPLISVASDGACLVDPLSAESIKNGVVLVINNKEYREKLIEKGFENAKQYSSKVVSKEYYKLYLQMLKGQL